MFPIAAILLIGAMFWGVQESRARNAVEIKAENQYQRAFHDLTFHVENLNTELGNALAVHSSSNGFHRKCLMNAWRLTSEAQNEINQLPLAYVPFQETKDFLSKTANFSYQTAVRNYEKAPLTEKEFLTLKTLYDHSNEISEQLRSVQSDILDQHLSFLQVDMAMFNLDEPLDNSITTGFKTMNQTVQEYSEVDWGPSLTNMFENRDYSKIKGKDHNEKEILRKAAEFLDIPESTPMDIVENGRETDFQSYSVTVPVSEGEDRITMDYSKKGGKLIWLMNPREINEKILSYNQVKENALQFLKDHDYPNMTPIHYDEYNNLAHITFASTIDDIIIYPDKVSVRVAQDNGEITGLLAADYVFKHNDNRTIDEPLLSLGEAKKRLNENFKVNHHAMALIENDLKEETLCHQFKGKINGSNYTIFINAYTGDEEKIEELK